MVSNLKTKPLVIRRNAYSLVWPQKLTSPVRNWERKETPVPSEGMVFKFPNKTTYHAHVPLDAAAPHTDGVAVAERLAVRARHPSVLPAAHCLVPDEALVTAAAPEGPLVGEKKVTCWSHVNNESRHVVVKMNKHNKNNFSAEKIDLDKTLRVGVCSEVNFYFSFHFTSLLKKNLSRKTLTLAAIRMRITDLRINTL